jgi:ACS family hexuronate transporter-like MFS transporter
MTGNRRWMVCALLFFATTINYLDRQVIGLLKPLLENEFAWSESDYGNLVVAFSATYAIGLLFFGRLIDRVGAKAGYAICVAVWSIAAIGHAAARGTLSFIAARGLLGFGESGSFPAAIKTVSEWFPQKERALAVGILTSGTNIGAVLAPATVPWLAAVYGWQWAFILTGLVGFVWLALWMMFFQPPHADRRLSRAEYALITGDRPPAAAADSGGWLRLMKRRETWSFIAGKFMTDPVWWFMLFWLPSYFSQRYALDLKHLGLPLVIVYTSTTIGSIGGGWLSSRLIARGWPTLRARRAAMLLLASLVLPLAAAPYVTDMWTMVALLSLAAAAHQGWSANLFTMPSDLFAREVVGSVVGIGGMAGSVGGMVFPVVVGVVLDHYKALGHLNAGYNLLFVICGVTYLFAWVVMVMLGRGPAGLNNIVRMNLP